MALPRRRVLFVLTSRLFSARRSLTALAVFATSSSTAVEAAEPPEGLKGSAAAERPAEWVGFEPKRGGFPVEEAEAPKMEEDEDVDVPNGDTPMDDGAG